MNRLNKRTFFPFSSERRHLLQLMALTVMAPLWPSGAQAGITFQAWGQRDLTLGELTMAYAALPWRQLDDAPYQRGQPQ